MTHDMITLPGGTVYYRSQLQGALGELLSNIADFAVELQRSDLDIQSFACMLILTILGGKKTLQLPHQLRPIFEIQYPQCYLILSLVQVIISQYN